MEVLGLELAVSEDGRGSPVLLIHGMGLDQRMWDPEVGPLLAAGYRVIRYDLRGHGRSSVPPAGYRVVDFAAEAVALADALQLERMHVVGLSLGGSIAARLAVRHPARLRSVTVIGSMASGYPRLSPFIVGGGTSALVEQDGLDLATFRQRRLASFLYAPTVADPVAGPLARRVLLEALQTTAVLRETTAERLAGWPSPTDWELWTDPARAVPALVLAGSLDEPTFQDFTLDSATLPGTRTAIVEGSAHLANMSHAHIVDPLLLEHLAAAEASGPPGAAS